MHHPPSNHTTALITDTYASMPSSRHSLNMPIEHTGPAPAPPHAVIVCGTLKKGHTIGEEDTLSTELWTVCYVAAQSIWCTVNPLPLAQTALPGRQPASFNHALGHTP